MGVSCTTKPVGETNRSRQLAAASVLLLGAGVCAVTTVAGWPLFRVLLVLGVVATLAWLVDGSSQRYVGPGLAAMAVGGGITLYRALEVDGEHSIVYPLIGVALLAASLFNPMAIRGAGTFLLIVGSVVWIDTPWAPGWTLTGILAAWSVLEFARINRGEDTADDEHEAAPRSVDARSDADRSAAPTTTAVGAGR